MHVVDSRRRRLNLRVRRGRANVRCANYTSRGPEILVLVQRWRLLFVAVQTGAEKQALIERVDKIWLIHDAAASHVD